MISLISKIIRNIRIEITKILSKLQFHGAPLFLIYNLRGYRFKDTFTVLDILEPGDILLRSYDNYVTSLLIPGTWKHAGIAIDNKTIINALGDGVVYTDAIQFCRTDKLCILRKPNITQEQIENIVNIAKEQLGKKYDYDFLALDHTKFYCSELVAYCYKDICDIEPQPTKLFGFIPVPAEITPTEVFNCKDLVVVYNSLDKN